MKKHIVTSILYTVITAVLLGIGYPLVVTGLARVMFPKQANGSLIERNGVLVGSHLIGQPFTGPGYFWSRPSAAGNGYDAGNSGGSNYAPTNAALVTRVAGTVQPLDPKGRRSGMSARMRCETWLRLTLRRGSSVCWASRG